MLNKVKSWISKVFHQLIGIDDTPWRKSLGFGLGIFLGIFPGLGPIAALVVSAIIRVNSAAALLGSLITNTWVSIVTFALAVKIGSFLTQTDWQSVYSQCQLIVKNFTWENFFDASIIKIFYPLILGYIIIGLALGTIGCLGSFYILNRQKQRSTK